MKAVVCEDEEALQLFLEKQVCECMKEAGINGSCEVFSSAEELLEKGNPFYDLYLLDIQLGQMTGMELAEKIREKDDHAVILFATNYKEMIRKAFQVSALDYLVKPLDEVEVRQALLRSFRYLSKKRNRIALKNQSGVEIFYHEEIEILLQQMTAAEQKIFTANAVVNGILNLKLQKMEMAQIEYEFDIHIPEQLKIQGTDLGVLLGNLLDNAIEACQEFQGEKKIRLLIEYQNSGVVIHCENPCNEDTETLQTKKKDKINHGFGMGSIAQIVKKYDGFWEYQMKSGLFKVTVNLWEKSEMI